MMATISRKNAGFVAALAVALLSAALAFVLDAKPAFASGTVTVTVTGQGSVTGDGINCTQSGDPEGCSEFYADTTYEDCDPERKPPCVTITEEPYREFTAGSDTNGYVFDGWTGCDSVTGRVCGLTVSTSTGLTARFRDAQAPSVSAPTPGSGVQRGTITLGATASDNAGVTKVEFYNGATKLGEDTSAPYQFSWDTTTVSDGAKSITAKAFDAAGNSTTSTASTITVDNTAPALNVTGGPDGQTFGPGSTQTWTFSASDATSGVASVQCSVVATGSAPSFGACSGGNSSHSVTNRPGGAYTFTVRALDNGGLQTTQSRTFTVDTILPTIASPKPAPDSRISDRTPLISAVVRDMMTSTTPATLSSSNVKLYLDGNRKTAFSYDASTGKLSYQSGRLARGSRHTVKVVATDAAGNAKTRTWSFRISS